MPTQSVGSCPSLSQVDSSGDFTLQNFFGNPKQRIPTGTENLNFLMVFMGTMSFFWLRSLKLTAKPPENQGLEDEMSCGARPTFRSVCCLFSGKVSMLNLKTTRHSGDNKQPPEGVPAIRLQSW